MSCQLTTKICYDNFIRKRQTTHTPLHSFENSIQILNEFPRLYACLSYCVSFLCSVCATSLSGLAHQQRRVFYAYHLATSSSIKRNMTTLSGQLIFVFVIFLIYLLPRVYKNFLLTCIVYIVVIVVDDDQYFKKCASSDRFCKIVNISFIMVFGIHLIFGILLIVGDIKV